MIDFALLHRRPAGGARAGHHHRRRLPLLLHADARKFIIADTPGHVQYTRNMATGASTADVAIILIDARYGVLEQSRRHAYIAVAARHPAPGRCCINKMDLVDYRRAGLHAASPPTSNASPDSSASGPSRPFPISALEGDNVVKPSQRMPWYHGPYAARAPGDGADRRPPATLRVPLAGAVRAPPAPRLPRLRRPDRQRRDQAGRPRSR